MGAIERRPDRVYRARAIDGLEAAALAARPLPEAAPIWPWKVPHRRHAWTSRKAPVGPDRPSGDRRQMRRPTREGGSGDGRAGTLPARGFAALTVGSLGVVFGDIGTSPLYAFR